jgi:hypothetical protein
MGEAMTGELDGMLDCELRQALIEGVEIPLMRNILVRYRERDFPPQAVYELLDSMRVGAGEDIEDRILELMDIASGFCSPHMRVW